MFPEHPCDKTFYTSPGIINSPGYPGLYLNYYDSCLAEIVGPPGSQITLDFVTFSM